jgi:hypothetical protein
MLCDSMAVYSHCFPECILNVCYCLLRVTVRALGSGPHLARSGPQKAIPPTGLVQPGEVDWTERDYMRTNGGTGSRRNPSS